MPNNKNLQELEFSICGKTSPTMHLIPVPSSYWLQTFENEGTFLFFAIFIFISSLLIIHLINQELRRTVVHIILSVFV